MARVFRNREGSRLHSPEFTLLEWYRAGAGWRDLVADCRGLLQAAAQAGGEGVLRMGEAVADPSPPGPSSASPTPSRAGPAST